MALFVPQWSPELVGDVIIAQNVCSNLYRVVVASFVVMLLLPLAYLLSASFGAFSGAILGCFALLDFFDWVCSCNEPCLGDHAAVARSPATRRRGPRRRGGHAAADLSATRRPRVGPTLRHAAAGPPATQRLQHHLEPASYYGVLCRDGYAAAMKAPATTRRPRDGRAFGHAAVAR